MRNERSAPSDSRIGSTPAEPYRALEQRTLTFPNGETLVEELDTYDPAGHEYDYRMTQPNVKALPASSCSVVFKLIPEGERTRVEWKSHLYRGDTGNEPPEPLGDEAATRAMTAFFRVGLDRLKSTVEKAP